MMLRCAMIALSLVLAGGAQARSFTIEDALAIREVSDARLSPDGRWIAYVETRNDLEKDEQASRIFVVATDGAETRAMTGETYSASAPRWSPDGRYLSFIAARSDLDENAAAQVYTLDLRGGDAEAFSNVPQGVEGYEWSPDGKRMALLVRDESEDAKAARESGETAAARPVVIDRRQFKEDGVGYLDRTRAHLYLLDARGGDARQITFGDFEDSAPQWRPDGAELVFVSNRTEEPDSNDNTDLWIVSGNPGAKDRKARQLTTNAGADLAPTWSPDGARIAYISSVTPALIWYATNHLALIDAGGGAPSLLTEAIDRNFSAPRFAPDGDSVLASIETNGEQRLVEISLATGAARMLIGGADTVYDFDLHPSGALVAALTRPDLPGEIFHYVDGALTQATRVNETILKDVRFALQQRVSFKSADGTIIQGFLYAPTNGRKRAPAILNIHGGPTSQYDGLFDPEAQLYAANGFAVIQPNPRGSTGFGEKFAAALFADWGGVDFDDVMAAVDDAIARGVADPRRLGVGGWSYGGILTNHVITKTTRFKAAVSGASEVVYIGNYGHDIYQQEWEQELGLPWENREAWEKITPFYDVAKVTTPTLVIGGAEDWNVPIINSEQLYQALKRLGVTTELVVYPEEDHSIDRPSFVRDRYERYLDWYRKYLK